MFKIIIKLNQNISFHRIIRVFFADAKLWKDMFEKAKKIVETECEAYSGKPESDETDSEVSSSDSEEDSKKQDKDGSSSSKKEDKKHSKDQKKDNSEANTKGADDVTADLEKLKVKEQD